VAQIGVGEDDVRRLAAQLEGEWDDTLGGDPADRAPIR